MPLTLGQLSTIFLDGGFVEYPKSFRTLKNGWQILVAKKNNKKYLCCTTPKTKMPKFSDVLYSDEINDTSVRAIELNWENYLILKPFGLAPTICDQKASFGTGDRLGIISCAHMNAATNYNIFPVIAQQSPRELEKTGRTFKGALLDAVMGYIESGSNKAFGADADHIKNEKYLNSAIEAGYSMYTIDLSDWLKKTKGITGKNNAINKTSTTGNAVIMQYKQYELKIPGDKSYKINRKALVEAALVYDKSLENVKRFVTTLREKLDNFELEISVDEYPRDTTIEDHLFVVEYLRHEGIEIQCLAPKFPGEFQKAVDFRGNINDLRSSLQKHVALAEKLGNYRLSLHSGSDKFSIYEIFSKVTNGQFHIKTSGTSWLRAVEIVVVFDKKLFEEMYQLCRNQLDENKKSYHVSIQNSDFPAKLPEDTKAFFNTPNVQQLFHISYGTLLHKFKERIMPILREHENEHYRAISLHIERHMQELFA